MLWSCYDELFLSLADNGSPSPFLPPTCSCREVDIYHTLNARASAAEMGRVRDENDRLVADIKELQERITSLQNKCELLEQSKQELQNEMPTLKSAKRRLR